VVRIPCIGDEAGDGCNSGGEMRSYSKAPRLLDFASMLTRKPCLDNLGALALEVLGLSMRDDPISTKWNCGISKREIFGS
jgi:hypothetical protein